MKITIDVKKELYRGSDRISMTIVSESGKTEEIITKPTDLAFSLLQSTIMDLLNDRNSGMLPALKLADGETALIKKPQP